MLKQSAQVFGVAVADNEGEVVVVGCGEQGHVRGALCDFEGSDDNVEREFAQFKETVDGELLRGAVGGQARARCPGFGHSVGNFIALIAYV
jgi:hypothetical protein